MDSFLVRWIRVPSVLVNQKIRGVVSVDVDDLLGGGDEVCDRTIFL